MTLTAEEIDRIVQEVIRRLTSAGIPVGTSGESTKTILELEERLVTLATIQGRLDGIEQLVVLPKAVVTPSVRDELWDKGIGLVRRIKQ
jgi:hypothetical protein